MSKTKTAIELDYYGEKDSFLAFQDETKKVFNIDIKIIDWRGGLENRPLLLYIGTYRNCKRFIKKHINKNLDDYQPIKQ
jgi:hypothetical protein